MPQPPKPRVKEAESCEAVPIVEILLACTAGKVTAKLLVVAPPIRNAQVLDVREPVKLTVPPVVCA